MCPEGERNPAMSAFRESLGTIDRTAQSGLHTTISDNAEHHRFELSVDGHVIGRQPYTRYREHFVLMHTEVDAQWRERGVSSALIDGVLGLVRNAGTTVIPRCKLTGDYILRHPEYRDLVATQYQGLLKPVSRPAAAPPASDSGT
jgi:predicted GNAT family acetyltransferase